MKALLVAIATVSQLMASGPQAASASPQSIDPSPCASLSLQFFPRIVHPAQGMDFDVDVSNCGSETERLTVRLDPRGPCRFLPRSRNVYVLEPGQGFVISALIIGPSCPGDYFMRGDVRLAGLLLDRDVASFRVLDPAVTSGGHGAGAGDADRRIWPRPWKPPARH